MKIDKYQRLKAVAFSLALIACSSLTLAKGDKEGRALPSQKMIQELKLTDTQVKEIKTIHEKNREKMKGNKEKVHDAREALHKAMQSNASESELREKFSAVQEARQTVAKGRFEEILEVRKVLTEEQRKQFRGMKEGMREGRKGFRGDRKSETFPPGEAADSPNEE